MSGPRRRCGDRRPERTSPAVAVGDYGNGYVEVDPTGRYGRFDDLLGKGAMKSVYRGFDEERGVEVAWNQASLADVLRTGTPDDAVQRMHSEVQLLSRLRHYAIIGFHASWVDVRRRSFNFITELFSSGTLRSYRRRYPRVSLRAVRSWARQILRGVAYLHAQEPPVIHRDLKCDNIFVNGNLQEGQVKIGDLGLAAVLRGGAARSVIGTPEFMAPEMYDEEYDERVDVYAFGMCVLEMITLEYPYAECSNPAQIYKKVTAGRLPDAFYRVDDDDARRFIGRCLVAAPERPSAAELLMDPFLLLDDDQPPPAAALVPAAAAAPSSETACGGGGHDHQRQQEERTGDMTITGKLNAEEDTVFLKVQIADEAGHVRNIYFPFDVASDTAAEVASEMVKELDITDRDAEEIAAMIEQEIDRLLPPGRDKQQQHDEYTYAAHDDDERPFCYLSSSSPTSSQGSLCGGMGPYYYGTGGGGFSGPRGIVAAWSSKDRWCALSDDDDGASSLRSGSGGSGTYDSALHYASGHEEEEAKNTTRFGPGDDGCRAQLARDQLQRQCSAPSSSRSPAPAPAVQHAGRPRRRDQAGDHHRRMPRNRSMVDMRSQLLHRTLVEELNRRLFFNTVGAVENIGFRAPSSSSSAASSSSSSSSASARGRARRARDDNKHHQYVML